MNKKVCIQCKHYKPDWKHTGYDPWYDKNEYTAYYTGKCYFMPEPVIKNEAWKEYCAQFEFNPLYDPNNSYWDQIYLKNPNK